MIEILRELHALSNNATRYSRSYYVRHLESYESIPLTEGHGIPDSPLCQKDWIWVAYSSKDDNPLAILIGAPMQGIAMWLRIFATEAAPTSIFTGVLRKALADVNSRGYVKYGVFLNPKEKYAEKLLRLVKKAGGETIPGEFTLVYGPTDISKW
jgi:hypothetical protein